MTLLEFPPPTEDSSMKDADRHNPQEYHQDSAPPPLPSLRSTSDTEAMGDFFFSSENFSLALEYFEKAYKQVQEEGPRAELWRLAFKIGDSYRRKGLFNEAREWFYLAQRRLEGREESVEYGLILDRLGSVFMNTGALEDGLQHCFQAYERLKNSPLHAEVAENLNRIAIIYTRLGYPKEAREFFTDALVTFRRIDHHLGVTCATMNLGVLKKNDCEFNEALTLFRKSLDLAKQHSLHKIRLGLLLNIGIVYNKMRRYREAAEMFIRARRLAREAGDEQIATHATVSLGRIQVKLGNLRRAEKLLLEGRVMAEKNRQRRSVALADEFLGELAEARGDYEAAQANYEAALELARECAPQGDIVVEVLQRLSAVKLLMGLPLDAIRLADRGLKLVAKNGELFEQPYLTLTQARSWHRLGEEEKAEIAFKNTLRGFKQSHDAVGEDLARLEYSEFLFERPTLERALRARKIVEDVLQAAREEWDDRFLFRASLLLARLENWLGDLDRALLAVFDAEGSMPVDASAADQGELEQVRKEIEQRKIVNSGRHFGFLPGHNAFSLSPGGKEELAEDIQRAWRALFELCEADAGCLSIKQNGSAPLRFLEGIDQADLQRIQERYGRKTALENGGDADAGGDDARSDFLYQPLQQSGKDVGFLFLQRRNGGGAGFSREMSRYLAGFARMVMLLAIRDDQRVNRGVRLPREMSEATSNIITRDPVMLDLLHLAGKVAETPAWVLLCGDTGTGKGVLAYAIHRMSGRREQSFINVNCAALPEELLESELFGHVKGSFTGAYQDKPGLIEAANGGTLFLDEVGKTSLRMQAKLLQFLDSQEIRRVGSNHSIPVDVRLITATKTDLKELAVQGRFLEDLYYRLNDFPLIMPPLRQRQGDISMLADYFIDRYGREFAKRLPGFTPAALAKLEAYAWPGNVRELEKVVKRALLLSSDGQPVGPETIILEDAILKTADDRDTGHDLNLKRQVEELERQLVLEALEQCQWNRTLASRSLGISYPTLLQKIRKFELEN
ncbi:MAG: sigma 54-interacting transcriptional regulator [Candidatus Krumholzibacteriota bacterium]|nr:sigma 54-interacting transcriptional regulator [Candidatus Krumholzibacteriota bacterium]